MPSEVLRYPLGRLSERRQSRLESEVVVAVRLSEDVEAERVS